MGKKQKKDSKEIDLDKGEAFHHPKNKLWADNLWRENLWLESVFFTFEFWRQNPTARGRALEL